MEKYKSLRNAVIALLIFGLLAFVCYGAIFTVLAVFETTSGSKFLYNHLLEIFYIFGFQSPYYLLLSINCYFIIFIIIVEFTLMLGISVVKGKATTVLPFILSVFSLTALIEIVANLSRYTAFDDSPAGKTGYVALFESFPTSTALAVMSLSLLLMAIIAVLVSFAVYVTAFVYTCIYKKPVKIKVIRKKVVRSKGAAALKKAQEEQEEPQFEEEPEPEPERGKDRTEELIELIRQILREERGERKEEKVLSSPLVVQYFNGLNTPQAEEQEPVQEEEPQPEPEPEPEVVEEPVQEEPAPVVEEAPAEEVPEKKPIIRIPFEVRITGASDEMKKNFNELKNDIMAYGVHSRVSNSGDTFRLHRKTFVKMTIAGKSLKLYFALNPADYMSSTFPIGNAGDKNIYAEIPLIFKVKSGLSVKRAKQLIYDVMSQNGLEQGEVGNKDWIEEIASQMKEGKLDDSDDGEIGEEDED